METYDRLDHTFLYASSLLDATKLYGEFSSLVKIVLAEAGDLQDCVSYNAAGKEQLLTDDDIVLGAKVVGYQYDSLNTEHSTRLSRRELDENARDPFAKDLRDDYHIRPYGYKSLSPVTASHDAKDLPATCVCRNGSDSGIPIWKLFEWQPKDAISTHPVSRLAVYLLLRALTLIIESFAARTSIYGLSSPDRWLFPNVINEQRPSRSFPRRPMRQELAREETFQADLPRL